MADARGFGRGALLAALAAVGFSLKAILVKLAYPYGVDAITLLALRMLFSLPFFLVMVALSRNAKQTRLGVNDWVSLAVLGLLGYYLASLLDFLGLQYVSAGLERLILFLYPTLVVVISALVLSTPITGRVLLALLLSYVGIALALTHDVQAAGGDVWRGAALVFGSAICYAIYLIGSGQMVGRVGAGRFTGLASTVACFACIAQFLLVRPWQALLLPWQVYALSLAMAVFSTVLPVYMISEAIRRIGAGPVALTGSLGPVATIFLGWLMLSEPVSGTQLAGAALVVVGVMMVGRARQRR